VIKSLFIGIQIIKLWHPLMCTIPSHVTVQSNSSQLIIMWMLLLLITQHDFTLMFNSSQINLTHNYYFCITKHNGISNFNKSQFKFNSKPLLLPWEYGFYWTFSSSKSYHGLEGERSLNIRMSLWKNMFILQENEIINVWKCGC
jgi:hypothetical protein